MEVRFRHSRFEVLPVFSARENACLWSGKPPGTILNHQGGSMPKELFMVAINLFASAARPLGLDLGRAAKLAVPIRPKPLWCIIIKAKALVYNNKSKGDGVRLNRP